MGLSKNRVYPKTAMFVGKMFVESAGIGGAAFSDYVDLMEPDVGYSPFIVLFLQFVSFIDFFSKQIFM